MKKYFPILLSKAGEIVALSRLSATVKNECVPIIQVLTEHLQSVHEFLSVQWTFDGNSVFLDFSEIEDLETNNDIRHYIQTLLDLNINVTAVVDGQSPSNYLNQVTALDIEICIRASNGRGGFVDFNAAVYNLLQRLNRTPDQTHLLLDLGIAEAGNVNLLSGLAINILSQLHPNDEWKTAIVAAGSFPENLSHLAARQVHRLERFEWDIWMAIHGRQELANAVKYGDYGTKHPTYIEVEYTGSASIKYTRENYFLIYRGELASNHPRGNKQYIDQARSLIATPEYSGANFSWGDARIQEIAGQDDRPGNAKTWVEISQNHHITLMCSLL